MSENKNYNEILGYHQSQHDMLKAALRVTVSTNTAESGSKQVYWDTFGDEGKINYNLFRGNKYGEGHADRILDHYLSCRKMGYPIKCNFSDDYMAFLHKKKTHGVKPPTWSLRYRLMT